VLFTVVLAASAVTILRSARGDARLTITSVAGTAAQTVESALAVGRSQLAVVARNPIVPTLRTTPPPCPLQFELLPGSRLDVVLPDGTVACSSDEEAVGTTHEGSTWLAQLRAEPGAVDTGGDAVVGAGALASAVPVVGPAGDVVGAIVMVVPAMEVAAALRDLHGGAQAYRFGAAGCTPTWPDRRPGGARLGGRCAPPAGATSGTPRRAARRTRSAPSLLAVQRLVRQPATGSSS
jgi:hypothetical protein